MNEYLQYARVICLSVPVVLLAGCALDPLRPATDRAWADATVKREQERTQIHQAAEAGDIQKVKSLLADNPALVNAKDSYGMTPLQYASERDRDKEIVELLLAHGADVNTRSTVDLWTPLHRAACYGCKEVAALLLAHGADVNAKNDRGKTPLTLASQEVAGNESLNLARREVAELLRHHGGN